MSGFFCFAHLVVFAAMSPDFENSWNFYKKRVAQGVSHEEKIYMLEKMERSYGDKGIDLSDLRKEKSRVVHDVRTQISASWAFYLRRVKEGASNRERSYILEKMQKRYGESGANVGFVREEMERVEALEREKNVFGETVDAESVAAPAPPPEKTKTVRTQLRDVLFLQIEYLPDEDVLVRNKQDAQGMLPGLLAAGYDFADAGTHVADGIGCRLGLMWPVMKYFGWGGSGEYIIGPKEETAVNGVSRVALDGRLHRTTETNFFRFLAQGEFRVPLYGRFSGRFGAGAGYATCKLSENTGNSGTFVSALGAPIHSKISERWDGWTWEFSPGLVWRGDNVVLEAGIVSVFLPTMKQREDLNEFKWNPTGIRLRLQF